MTTRSGGVAPPLLPLLESPRAVLRALDIASADAPVAALLLGAEDLAAALGVARTRDGEELILARGQIAMAAGQGVTRLGGDMVELPMVERARRLMALAGLLR